MNYVLSSNALIGGVLGRGAPAATAAGNGLLTGLVAYWKLDEASGNAIDAHSSGLTLTQAGTVSNGTGLVYAKARGVFAAGNYFSRASSSAIETGNIDFAVAVWVYLASNSSQYMNVVAKGQIGTGYELLIAKNFLSIYCNLWKNGVTSVIPSAPLYASGSISVGAWALLMLWHNAAESKLYININNGTPASATLTDDATAANVPLAIGAWYGGGGAAWNGYIGPVAFWKNRTLDATARTALWNGGAGLAYSAFTA